MKLKHHRRRVNREWVPHSASTAVPVAAIQSSQVISNPFPQIYQTTLSKNYSAFSRDYAALSRDYGSLSKDYAEYSILSVHNPINSTAIESSS